MGLFDQIAGAAMGALQQGGAQPPAVQQLLQMLQQSGGLHGLLDRLRQGGLAELVQAWVAQGPNPPVSPAQLNSALGPDQVQHMATAANMPATDLLGLLSQHLPGVVDQLSPHGTLPQDLGGLLQAGLGLLNR